MPAKSKSQQRFFSIVNAIQHGQLTKKSSKKASDVAKSMSPKEVRKFAETKTKNLPEKVKKESLTNLEKSLLLETILFESRAEDYIKKRIENLKHEILSGMKYTLSIEDRIKTIKPDVDDPEYLASWKEAALNARAGVYSKQNELEKLKNLTPVEIENEYKDDLDFKRTFKPKKKSSKVKTNVKPKVEPVNVKPTKVEVPTPKSNLTMSDLENVKEFAKQNSIKNPMKPETKTKLKVGGALAGTALTGYALYKYLKNKKQKQLEQEKMKNSKK